MARKKRKDWQFGAYLPDGSRKKYRFKSKEERDVFKLAFKEKLRKILSGEQINVEAPTILEHAKSWLVRREQSILKGELTLAGWDVFERHFRLYIIPNIGQVPLNQLTTEMAEEFLKSLTDIGAASRNRIRSTLLAFYNDKEVRRTYGIKINPITDVEKEKEKRPNQTIIHSLEDAERWIAEAYKLGPMWGCLETLLLNAGPRKSQFIPLRWCDYEEDLSRIWMGRMWEAASRTIQNRTKGREESESFYVGVNNVLAKALSDWKLQSPWTEPFDYIFSLKKGKYLDPTSIDIRHNLLRKTTSIDMTFHGGRHTYGSQFLAQGGSLEGAQAQLGHKSKNTTEGFYKHAVKKNLRSLANVVTLGNGTSSTKKVPNTQGDESILKTKKSVTE